ncbi:ZP and PAN domain-containing protein neyo isoform 1-T2 [Cochliomyia hominivorax]
MSFRILTPLTTNRMSRLIFITLLSVLILTPQSIQAARRSRLDLTASNASNTETAAAQSATSTANNNDSESLKPASASEVASPSADNASALPLKTDQSSSAAVSSDSVASEALPLTQDNDSKLKDSAVAVPVVVDTGKSSATDLIAEDEKQAENSELTKEQKETPTASFEDVEVVESATQLVSSGSGANQQHEECDSDMLGFEIVTGYVFSAPGKLLDSLPGTLMLTDCLEACQSNETCQAVNYETGLCVLFSANADQLPGALTKSQFPVFTIYAQKACLGVRPCARAWCVDRVQNYKLNGHAKRSVSVTSRRDCFELCLGEAEFTCRSANYYRATNICELSEMDRITLAGTSAFQAHDGIDYLENNCAEEPNKLCEFKRLSGRILKTVDSVYQDVGSIDECRDLCINSPYRCHSYDFGDTGDMVCRLSHHSRATLSDVQDPYLEVPEAATYELSSCYNVTIECGAVDMVARIRTSKLFDGKVYAKGSPKSCSVDVKNSLEFELRMGYSDLECNVKQQGSGRYMNDVVIQHHDTIVTSSDLGLAVTCQFDLTNKSISNEVDLGVKGDIEPALSEEVIVDSPNVIMKITSRDGSDIMRSAEVGDPLALKFEILDESSPYEIFVRELVAMDGGDNAEITLIDSNGCPTDHFIMGPIYKSSLTGKILLSHFDAFKFPSSEVVQFRALVTPCMPTCEPVQCDQEDISGEFKSLLSFGRKRRSLNVTASFGGGGGNVGIADAGNQQHQLRRQRRETTKKPSQEDMLLVQSIQITDKFGFDKQQQQQSKGSGYDTSETVFIASDVTTQGFCVNAIGLIVAATVFLLAQLAVIAIWTYLYQRRRKLQPYSNEGISSASSYGSHTASVASTMQGGNIPNARSESLCKLYEGGFAARHGRQF